MNTTQNPNLTNQEVTHDDRMPLDAIIYEDDEKTCSQFSFGVLHLAPDAEASTIEENATSCECGEGNYDDFDYDVSESDLAPFMSVLNSCLPGMPQAPAHDGALTEGAHDHDGTDYEVYMSDSQDGSSSYDVVELDLQIADQNYLGRFRCLGLD